MGRVALTVGWAVGITVGTSVGDRENMENISGKGEAGLSSVPSATLTIATNAKMETVFTSLERILGSLLSLTGLILYLGHQ